MHDSMQYDPIQGQGHESFKVGNPAILNSYLLVSAVKHYVVSGEKIRPAMRPFVRIL